MLFLMLVLMVMKNCWSVLTRFSKLFFQQILFSKRWVIISLVLGLGMVLFTATPSQAVARRCGWLDVDNSTPYWTLTDRDGRWTLRGVSHRAQGLGKMPTLAAMKATGFPYYTELDGGDVYGCSCMDVSVDSGRVISLSNFKQQPVTVCDRDRSLPRR
jgi:hypothetical protein